MIPARYYLVQNVAAMGTAGAPPHFSSAEIGAVNATTVAVTFDTNVSASDYTDGVTIQVNGLPVTIALGTRQSDHAVVYYALTIPVLSSDTVTWEYAQASGSIAGETGGVALADVTAQSVTNNVAAWYVAGGVALANCIAAYQAVGAASYAASKSNLASPGTHDAADGVAVAWDAAIGWTSDGNKYLTTDVVHGDDWSALIEWIAVSDDNNLFGALHTVGGNNYLFLDTALSNLRGSAGSDIKSSGVAAHTGFAVVCRDGVYFNTVLKTGAFAAPTATNAVAHALLARKVDGAYGSQVSGSVRRAAFYNIRLSNAQQRAITLASLGLADRALGAWCWFQDPRAVYYNGNTYFGATNHLGDAMVYAYNHATNGYSSFSLHDALQIDDHDAPAFLIRASDQKILAFYSLHNGTNMRYRISSNAEDISAWAAEQTVAVGGVNTYANPIQLTGETNSPIYLFCRGSHTGGDQSNGAAERYVKSTDGGSTWGSSVEVYYIGSDASAAYAKLAPNGNARIDFAVTDGHPNDVNSSIYHFYYEGDKYYTTDGSEIVSLPVTPASASLVYDGSTIPGWIWDIAIDGDGNPIIVYDKIVSSSDHRYRYARWNGSAWVDNEICAAGGQLGGAADVYYAGGVYLDHAEPTIVYASRQVSGQFEIYKYVTANGGTSFTETALTANSPQPQVRPIVPRGSTAPLKVMWYRGIYGDYLKYLTGIVGM